MIIFLLTNAGVLRRSDFSIYFNRNNLAGPGNLIFLAGFHLLIHKYYEKDNVINYPPVSAGGFELCN